MTTKAAAVKKKKKARAVVVAPVHREDVPVLIDVRISPVPILKASLVCEVDDRKRWKNMSGGMIDTALPRIARVAATLTNAQSTCFFCGTRQEPIPKATMFHFGAGYPLCLCLMRLRRKPYDYIPGWSTPAGGKELLRKVESGELLPTEPVYQFVCRCGEGPVVVHAGLVANSIANHNSHNKKSHCDKCQLRHKREKMMRPPLSVPLTVPISEAIGSPKSGPEALLGSKRKNKKGRHGRQRNAATIPVATPQPTAALEVAPEAPTT